ncbi:MAG: caspase family protein, partial [Deltaproteobacteria bacterium]|nr:caspase family protein [Deltaproteobacteria bacterium]
MPPKVPGRPAGPGAASLLAAPVLALAAALAAPAPAAADKHALLIGINAYTSEVFRPLSGSLNDVELMKGVLTDRLGFPAGNVATLTDEQATRSGVIGAMTELAGRIQPGDQVYVQYSGHGSTTCDLNLDDGPRGFDSTLVTYGSRSGVNTTKASACAAPATESAARAAAEAARDNPDDYDLIDDRVNELVAALRAKADLVVFVSDSCHSATITRSSDALPTRGAPVDGRVNPDSFMERKPAPSGLGDYISIGSANLEQKATEYATPDGKGYGIFTWSWARALNAARPGDTWQHVAHRTKAYMNEAGHGAQTPVVEGTVNRQVFEGAEGGRYVYTVLQAFDREGKRLAELNAGLLAGVGPGTVFLKGNPEAPEARLTVVSSTDLKSQAEVTEGAVSYGDDVDLFNWVPPGLTLKIRYQAALDSDRELVARAREVFSGMSIVEELKDGDGAQAEIVAWILRPGAAPQAAAPSAGSEAPEPAAFLPPSDPSAAPEIWLVSPAEDSFLWGFDRLRAPLDDKGPGELRRNFELAARAHNIMTLEGPPGPPVQVSVSYLMFRPVGEPEWAASPQDRRFPAQEAGIGHWVFTREVPAADPEVNAQGDEELVVIKA